MLQFRNASYLFSIHPCMNLKETAEYYRIGALVGFIPLQDAIAWADAVIMAEPEPHIAIIEASLCGSKHPADFSKVLMALPGEANHQHVIRQLLKAMYNTVVDDISASRRIARCLYNMDARGYVPDNDTASYMIAIEYEFQEAAGGWYGTVDAVQDELVKFLRQFANE